MSQEPAFVCPGCGARSWNLNDGLHGWCERCKAFTAPRPTGRRQKLLADLFAQDLHQAGSEAAELARKVMEVTEQASSRTVAGAALHRAMAGFWARLALDAGDPPAVAAESVLFAAVPTADLAFDILATRLEEARAKAEEARS